MHQYCTRSSGYNFLVPHRQNLDKSTFTYAATFTYAGIAYWNSLPACLKAVEKPQRFKVALKYFMKNYQETELFEFLFYKILDTHASLPSCLIWLR